MSSGGIRIRRGDGGGREPNRGIGRNKSLPLGAHLAQRKPSFDCKTNKRPSKECDNPNRLQGLQRRLSDDRIRPAARAPSNERDNRRQDLQRRLSNDRTRPVVKPSSNDRIKPVGRTEPPSRGIRPSKSLPMGVQRPVPPQGSAESLKRKGRKIAERGLKPSKSMGVGHAAKPRQAALSPRRGRKAPVDRGGEALRTRSKSFTRPERAKTMVETPSRPKMSSHRRRNQSATETTTTSARRARPVPTQRGISVTKSDIAMKSALAGARETVRKATARKAPERRGIMPSKSLPLEQIRKLERIRKRSVKDPILEESDSSTSHSSYGIKSESYDDTSLNNLGDVRLEYRQIGGRVKYPGDIIVDDASDSEMQFEHLAPSRNRKPDYKKGGDQWIQPVKEYEKIMKKKAKEELAARDKAERKQRRREEAVKKEGSSRSTTNTRSMGLEGVARRLRANGKVHQQPTSPSLLSPRAHTLERDPSAQPSTTSSRSSGRSRKVSYRKQE